MVHQQLQGVLYENGTPIFIDTEYDSWNMDPVALAKAFEMYPDVKMIVVAHLYGTPGKIDEIRKIANEHGALIIEDAAESLGATYNGVQTGCFGDYRLVVRNCERLSIEYTSECRDRNQKQMSEDVKTQFCH